MEKDARKHVPLMPAVMFSYLNRDGACVMLDDVVEGVLKFIFHILLEIICFYTGEVILFIITFGHKKPRWDYYDDVSPSKWVIITKISFWIGALFWIMVAIFLARYLT